MVLEADRNGCASRGAGRSPRRCPSRTRASARPSSSRPADEKHARFADKDSDFLTYLNLWRYLREQQQELSRQPVPPDVQDRVPELPAGPRVAGHLLAAAPGRPHPRAVARRGRRGRARRPARAHRRCSPACSRTSASRTPTSASTSAPAARKFAIFPGSALFKKPPRWVMAAELVETSRLWGRVAARIEPEWVEPLAGHLVKRSYSEPHWEKKQGAVMAYEKVTLYGVPIVAARKVNYGRIDPALSPRAVHPARAGRGRLGDPPPVLRRQPRAARRGRGAGAPGPPPRHPRRRRDAVRVLRRSGSPPTWCPAGTSTPGGRRPAGSSPDLLTFTRELLVNAGRGGVDPDDYPDAWQADGLPLPLTYQFEPGAAADGVTVHVPLAAAQPGSTPTTSTGRCPGLREELVTALIRVAAQAAATQLRAGARLGRRGARRITPRAGPLLDALGAELRRLTGTVVPRDAWRPGRGARPPADDLPGRRRGRQAGSARGKDLDGAAPQPRPEGAADDLRRRAATSSAGA